MPLFALETSSERLSLAIMDGSDLFVREIDAGQRHSELAVNAIAELFVEAKLAVADMDVIAFGQGPGSFVGVRIACGLAQGLALGAAKKVLPVQTQMALAEQAFRVSSGLSYNLGSSAGDNDNVLVAIDARMNEIYLAVYQRDASEPSGWRPLIAPVLVKPQDLPELTGAKLHWTGIGSAFDSPMLYGALAAHYPFVAKTISHALPCASDVAAIALRQWERANNDGEGAVKTIVDPSAAAPLYLRNQVAQTIEERSFAAAKMAATHLLIKENNPLVASR